LVRVGWQGDVVSVVGGGGSAFLPDRVQWQIETRNNPTLRLEFCCDLISAKVANAITTLRTTIPDSPARDKAIATGQATIDALRARRVRTVNDVMMAEARAASAYFTAWRGLPLNWRSKNRYPVPQGWLSASSRRTLRDSRSATNRNATHPVNAMLNYAYALLHSQVQAAAVANGYDPRQGIMHESRPDAMALVLDLMEPQRAVVDAKVLKFVAAQTFSGADFVIRDDGVCRLAPQLARRICQTTTAEGFME
jgi:CRISPR-associated endonuclease Cas1